MSDALNIWMNGAHVGIWSKSRSGVATFQYEANWTKSRVARALSLSLPITAGNGEHRGEVVDNYFENLLPESLNIRNRLRSRFKTKSIRAFDLLTAIGRDCVGAVQILPEHTEPEGWDRVESEPLNEDQIERILKSAASGAPLGQRQDGDDDFRISIAGAQEKTALLRFGQQWRRPHGATPTTHILKLPLGLVGNMQADLKDSVENEWLCAQIVREFGLPVAIADMAIFGGQKALVVQRFDRRWQGIPPGEQDLPGFNPRDNTWIARLPQEDLCQATGTPPTQKYESDGGPSMQKCLDILGASADAEMDRKTFVLAQFAFWMLAATDGHAKNFSLSHYRGGTFGLAPLYDVISAWPIIGRGPNQLQEQDAKLAMAVRAKNAHYKLTEIHARHWQSLAQRNGVPGAWPEMQQMAQDAEAVLKRVESLLPDNFPRRVWDSVESGVKKHAIRFLHEATAIGPTKGANNPVEG